MRENCRNCSRKCLAPGIISNGLLCCEKEKAKRRDNAVCGQCGEKLELRHFAYEGNSREFWCENCIRALYESLTG